MLHGWDCLCRAASTRSGVIGTSVMRTPVALWIALATAAPSLIIRQESWRKPKLQVSIPAKAGAKNSMNCFLLSKRYKMFRSPVGQTVALTVARVLPPIELLRSACAVNAELLGQEGRLGCVREGAFADLLVVDGDPLTDISVLTGNGERLSVIMSSGRFHKRTI